MTPAPVDCAAFAIRHDGEAGILHLVLRGFWTVSDFAAFSRDLAAATETLRRAGARWAMLSDSSGFAVQSAEISRGFAALMIGGTVAPTGRTAIVVGSVMNKMQAGRVFTNPSVGVFLAEPEARHWLATGERG